MAREFLVVLTGNGLGHHRIKAHCPEENGTTERAYRTTREALDGEELTNLVQAQAELAKVVRWYNEERLHSALGHLPPAAYYRGAECLLVTMLGEVVALGVTFAFWRIVFAVSG